MNGLSGDEEGSAAKYRLLVVQLAVYMLPSDSSDYCMLDRQ
jgi:hypothetical protein